jgi:sugar phosphate isomerase/epimerase
MSWRIAMATGGSVTTPILQVLDRLSQAGFRAVEIGTPPKHFDPWQRAQVEGVAEFLRRSSIAAVSIHAPFGGILDLSDPNPHRRGATMAGIIQAASMLRELGGTVVVVHPTDVPRDSGEVGPRLDACSSALATLAESCAKMGLRLAIESPLPHLIGGNPEEFRWLLGRVNNGAGVCIDTSHTFLGGYWADFLKIADSKLLHIHASDNRGTFDDHLAPGDGIIDWGTVVDGLSRVGYSGWVVLEVAFRDGEANGKLGQIRVAAEKIFGQASE